MKRLILSFCAVLLLLTGPALAQPRSDEADAKALLLDALVYMRDNGIAASMKAFNEKKGAFRRGDLYVFAFHTDGTYLASGANPALVGQDVEDLSDALGTPIFQPAMEQTRTHTMAVIHYEWLNRMTNDVENKTSFVIRDGNVLLGVGFYTPK